MDQLNLDIIAILQRDGRKSFTEIARVLGVSEGTIRNRVTRLTENKVIQIIGMADPRELGFDAPAIIGLSVVPASLEDVARQVAAIPQVSYLIMVSGEFDLMVEVMCRDREQLTNLLKDQIHSIQGITRTQTFFILHTYKMAYGALPILPDKTGTSTGPEE